MEEAAGYIGTFLRARPRLGAELSAPEVVTVTREEVTLHATEALHSFRFDGAFEPSTTQEQVWAALRPSAAAVLDGYHAAIMAFGQTGAGKTFTMVGDPDCGPEADGVIPRAVRELFERIKGAAAQFVVRVSYLQIYNETLSDLLQPATRRSSGKPLTIREDPRHRGIYVENLSETIVSSEAEVSALLRRGNAARVTAATAAHELSSRSHAIFTIALEQINACSGSVTGSSSSTSAGGSFDGMSSSTSSVSGGGADEYGGRGGADGHTTASRFRVSRLHLIDLAGSESARSGVSGQRLQECRKINASLSALGNVIHALSRTPRAPDARGALSHPHKLSSGPISPFGEAPVHVPYRDSKLTRLLQECVGGNSVCTLIACVSSSSTAAAETLSTLRFASRARRVRTYARINSAEQDLSASTLRQYEKELGMLRAQAASRTQWVEARMGQLEEETRRAHADKLAALRELEQRSLEVAHERTARASLEAHLSRLGGARSDNSGSLGEWAHGVEEGLLEPRRRGVEALEALDAAADVTADATADVAADATADADADAFARCRSLVHKQRELILALTQKCCERDAALLSMSEQLADSQRRELALEERLDSTLGELGGVECGPHPPGETSDLADLHGTTAIGEALREREIEALREGERLAAQRCAAAAEAAEAEASELRRQARTHAKERTALVAILEGQVALALQRTSSALDQLARPQDQPPRSGHDEREGIATAPALERAALEIRSLEGLVTQCVAALRLPGTATGRAAAASDRPT